MKRLLAKTLTSTALVLVTFTAAHAGNHNQSQSPFPTASEENPRWFSPAQLQYWEKREAAIAKELKDRPVKSDYRPYAQPRSGSFTGARE